MEREAETTHRRRASHLQVLPSELHICRGRREAFGLRNNSEEITRRTLTWPSHILHISPKTGLLEPGKMEPIIVSAVGTEATGQPMDATVVLTSEGNRDYIPVRINPQDPETAVLCLRPPFVDFSYTTVNCETKMKITIRNRTSVEQLAEIHPLPDDSPFIISSHQVKVPSQDVSQVEITFHPTMPGLMSEILRLETSTGEILTTTLHGRALAPANPN